MTLVTLPYRDTLSQGKPEVIGQVLTDFDTIVAVVNGQLSNNNVSPNAAIQLPKLAIAGVPTKTKYLRDDATWQIPASGHLRTIEDKTLTTDVQFDFLAIPLTYKHLLIHGYFRSTRPSTDQSDMMVRFNDDSGAAQYDWYEFQVDSPGTPTKNPSEGLSKSEISIPNCMGGATSAAGIFNIFTMWIPNYTDTVMNKCLLFSSIVKRSTGTQQYMAIRAGGWWRSSAAITKISFLMQSGVTAAGSRAQLLGTM